MVRRAIAGVVSAVAAGMLAVPMVAAPPPVQAAATYTTALYEMNEPAGASTLIDSSGNGLHGTIGTEVQTNASYQGAVGHRYAYLAPNTPPAHPQHLDKVNDNTMLDPGTSDYAVNIRYRTTRSFGNLIQKGQNADTGGYFKIELPAGNITCLYKDATGRQRAMTSPRKYNDGQWHTIRCERYGQNQITMYVDGVRIYRISGAMTNINNTKNLSIAGKSSCNQRSVTCDYFVGDIDWVRIEKGSSGPVINTPPTARFTESCIGLTCTFDGTTSTDPGGSISAYTWSFSDGPGATGATPTKTFSGPGTYDVSLTVTDNQGAANTTTHAVTVVGPNTAPTAAFTSSCAEFVCTLDGTASTDPDGDTLTYAWEIDDVPAGSTSTITPTLAPGTYAVELTVTDPGAASHTEVQQLVVEPNPPPVSAIAFVGQSSVSGNVTTHTANVPAGVQAGDALLMFFSGGTSPTTVGNPAGVTGWTQVDALSSSRGTTRVWRKVAGAGDAGAQVRITMSALTKGNLMIVAYRGTSALDPVAGFASVAGGSSATRTTPTVTVAGSTSWVVSYWMHRDSSSTSLSVPDSVTSRSTGTQTGGGRVTALLADSNGAVPAGPYGGLSATAQASSSYGTAWTIVLAPA